MKNTCASCRYYEPNHGECRLQPPVRLPRRFADDATAGNRVRDEEVLWGWPKVKSNDWCGHFSLE
jgi:hypothetical protein